MEIRKFGREEKVETTQKNENGVVTPKKLSNESISILNDRLKDEYTAHYFYRNAANWCRNMNYKKAASFFENEANSELEHAKGLQEYMDDFNVLPQMPKTETSFSFETLVDIVNQAYEMEYSLMESYNKSSSEVFTNDLTTFDFLQGYRTVQKEAVIEYSDLLNAIMLIDHTNKFEVLYFEQTYF